MTEKEIQNLLKKVQSGELKLSPEQKLELLKKTNKILVDFNNQLKNII